MKRFDNLKASFLAIISHKLKTPLTSLSLGLEELERYAATLNADDKCHQRLGSMREDMLQLSRLLTSLLRVQQAMTSSTEVWCRCDAAEIVRAALDAVEPVAQRKAVFICQDELPWVDAERGRMIFALQQILDNAFKFSSKEDTVTVSVEHAGEVIRIVVHDTGCGIPADCLPRVFDQLYQVDPDATGQMPGFGLGLFCAREIVRQHSGSIGIASQPGSGTTVTVTLKTKEE